MEDTLNERLEGEPANEPLMRPFEIVAIACGVATLIGTFAVDHTLVKGLLIGGSLLVLLGSLLYYGLVGARAAAREDHPTSAPRPTAPPRRDGVYGDD